MTYDALAKLVALVAALGAIWARFIALEEARDNQRRWSTEMAETIRDISGRVDVIERDKAMLERMHAIESRIGVLEEKTR